MYPIDDVIKLVYLIPTVYSNNSKNTAKKQFIDTCLTIYNERQSLDSYNPRIRVIIDHEDFMKKNNTGFNLIEYRLSDLELEQYEAWVKQEKITPVTALNYCASKDIKVSMTFATNNESWCVSLTGREDNRMNSGATLTSWSDEPLDGLYMAIFKATVIFGDGKWLTRKSSNRG